MSLLASFLLDGSENAHLLSRHNLHCALRTTALCIYLLNNIAVEWFRKNQPINPNEAILKFIL